MRKNSNKRNKKEQDKISRAGRVLLRKLEAARKKQESEMVAERIEYYIGIDLGDSKSYYCILDAEANILLEGSVPTTVAIAAHNCG
jgi:activator of 2-hydroxyglutaryl-CoA dehydratase